MISPPDNTNGHNRAAEDSAGKPQATGPQPAELSAAGERRLAEILDAYLTQRERGHQLDSADLIAAHPEFARELKHYLAGIEFLQKAADELQDVRTPDGDEPAFENQQLGDYQLVQEIGRGGMGIVYEARQLSLGRRVAIKILPFAAVLDPKQIARFTREAQAAAQLHHPHIVPIYAVGCERGVHYYSMQLIDGQTLEQALRQLRGEASDGVEATETFLGGQQASASAKIQDAASTERSSLTKRAFATDGSLRGKAYHRRCVEIMVHAAEALQHAHDYGVIHRDIKPSNLLIDARGKAWVTDFGVARLQNDAGVTATGDVIGTLRYMSPEQAAGNSVLIDHRSDVYSLGVTLYEMLTLKHPHSGVGQRDLVRHIESVEPRRPRSIDASIPVDLEKIIHKSIAKSREQRYQSAGEFAQDMQRFLDGKPVLAKPPSLVERASKWASRHRTLVASCLLLMTVTLIATTTASILVIREQFKTRRSQQQAAARFEKAREVVDRLGTSFAAQLADVPGAEDAQVVLLNETLQYYLEFAREATDDPSLQTDLAKTYLSMGRIHEQINGDRPALAAFREARVRFSDLVDSAPANSEHLRGLGLSWNNIGLILSRQSQADEATKALEQAAHAHRQAIDIWPTDATHQADLALVFCNLGHHLTADDRVQAESYYHQAIYLLRDILEKVPDEMNVQSHLALVYNNLSRLQAGHDNPASEQNTRESLRIQADLVARWPGNLRFQSDLALSWNNLGAFEKNNGQPDKARQSYQRAIDIRTHLARQQPSVRQHQRDLAISYNNLGMLEHGQDNLFACRAALTESQRMLSAMVQRDPTDPSLRSSLAGVFNNLGTCVEQLGELENAALAYHESVTQQQIAVESVPTNHEYQRMLARYESEWARIQKRLGDKTVVELQTQPPPAASRKRNASGKTEPSERDHDHT